jgi:hypothetical protein
MHTLAEDLVTWGKLDPVELAKKRLSRAAAACLLPAALPVSACNQSFT